MPNEGLEVVSETDNTLDPIINWLDGDKIGLRFARSCLRESKITYNHGKIVNIYIAYALLNVYSNDNYRTFKNALFGAVRLTKNTDINKYIYSCYEIRFCERGFFSHLDGRTGKNEINFGVDMSSSTKIDKKKIDILILGKGLTPGLGNQ